jgi:hypothetical protein
LGDGKSMDVETALETCLMQNSPIKGKDLREQLRRKGYSVSRSQFYRYGAKLKKSWKIAADKWYLALVSRRETSRFLESCTKS